MVRNSRCFACTTVIVILCPEIPGKQTVEENKQEAHALYYINWLYDKAPFFPPHADSLIPIR